MHQTNKNKLIIFIILAFVFMQCHGMEKPQNQRPEKWAQKLELPGLPNLHKVSDALYRGARPEKEGFAQLKKLGIKTIVTMRRNQKERKWFAPTDFRYIYLPVFTSFPSKKKFRRFLEIMADPANHPVFLHCKHGADRTGAATALYRVHLQGWTVDDALDEMIHGGFHFHNYRKLIKLVRKFKWQPPENNTKQ